MPLPNASCLLRAPEPQIPGCFPALNLAPGRMPVFPTALGGELTLPRLASIRANPAPKLPFWGGLLIPLAEVGALQNPQEGGQVHVNGRETPHYPGGIAQTPLQQVSRNLGVWCQPASLHHLLHRVHRQLFLTTLCLTQGL